MSSTSIGIATLIAAGVTNASFTLPMKYARKWAWENIWLAWTLFALIALPLMVTLMTVPKLLTVYRSAPPEIVLEVAGFGAGWGVAQVFFGLAVDMIGITLAFSVVLGTSAAIGSLIPMLFLNREHADTTTRVAILGAIGFVLLGVMLCAIAGKLRETPGAQPSRSPISKGLLLAIVCGLCAAFMNFAVAFGTPLVEAARSFGASGSNAMNVVWLPLMLAGAVPNLLYCAWLMKRNNSGNKYRTAHSHWVLAAIMAIFWFGSTLLYGLAAGQLGEWGPILGWPLFMSLIVITATMLGIFAGEWKGCAPIAIRIQWIGVTVLVLAVFVLASSTHYVK